MKIAAIISVLEQFAPPAYQESYDNSGLLIGNAQSECTGIICSLDATEAVVEEAKARGCNLIVAHHPIIFGGLKKITGKNYVEKTVISAIKNEVAIYAIHTNLDNIISGVNAIMADKLGLINRKILAPKSGQLMKLFTFAPVESAEHVRNALFKAGAGHIGNYSNCSFNTAGQGTYMAGEGADPHKGQVGKLHVEFEEKIEVIFPAYLKNSIVSALIEAHPYEEVAYDLVALVNDYQQVGSGLVGELNEPISEKDCLQLLKDQFKLKVIRHTPLLNKQVKKIALCGGAGSFLTATAIASGADFFVTGDVKYHEFFDANGKLVIADIGHWESEQFAIDLLLHILQDKFPTFAVLKTEVTTNPVDYFL